MFRLEDWAQFIDRFFFTEITYPSPKYSVMLVCTRAVRKIKLLIKQAMKKKLYTELRT
jgi:hypothetical protein